MRCGDTRSYADQRLMRGPHKLTHPLGPVKGGSTRPNGRTLQPPQKANVAPPAASAAAPKKSPAEQAVNALKPAVMLGRLAAQASMTEQRNPSSGR
jgi:hypothetical protein